jgi:cysteine desulfurase
VVSVVYLDYAATTPVAAQVLDAMLPFFTSRFGNASNHLHALGRDAAEAIRRSRSALAGAVGAQPRELVFTSGATESNHLAIRGAALARAARGRHVITSAMEHSSTLAAVAELERSGWDVTRVPAGANGVIDLGALEAAIRADTALVSIMLVNNETGVVQPLEAVVEIARSRDIAVHTDATQALGKIPVSLRALGVDLASFSAHKVLGPKGVGALYTRQHGQRPHPMFPGGGDGLRAGTANVPGIVGFGAAAELLVTDLDAERHRLARLRSQLLGGLSDALPGVRQNGSADDCVPAILNVSFEGVDGEDVVTSAKSLALGTGSACSTGRSDPSHVLIAMGLSRPAARGAVRFSLGRYTDDADVSHAVAATADAVRMLRAREQGTIAAVGP